MDRNIAWSIFKRTGNVEAYMLYKELNTKNDFNKSSIKENKMELLIK